MHRASPFDFLRRCFRHLGAGTNRAAPGRKRPASLHSSLRLEQLEPRALLSASPVGGPGVESTRADASARLQTPGWEIVISDDDGTLFGVDTADMSHRFLYQGVRFDDIAYTPWEDVDFYGFYGVSWSSNTSTTYLYHIEIDVQQTTTVSVGLVGEIRTTDNARVYLNALEFSDRGTLYAAGYRLGNDNDHETFTIDPATAVATHHQDLPAGFQSAGDIHFHRPDGSMYLTTAQAKLLKMPQPWSSSPPAFQIKPGSLQFGDFVAIGLQPSVLAWGFRQYKDLITLRYGVYPISLGNGSVNPGQVRWLGADSAMDDILGAASRYTTAKPDLRGGALGVPPEPATAGTSVEVTFEVTNQGAKNAGPFDVAFYLSADSQIATNDFYLGSWSSAGVAALRTTPQETLTLSLPNAADPFFSGTGTYYVGMIVDSGDGVFEGDETNNSNTGQGLDWDPLQLVVATLSIGDVTISPEGDAATADAVFTVSLSSPTSLEVTVGYQTAAGTATTGSDYAARSGTLTFPPFETTRTISVPVFGDTMDEDDESFFVDLSGASNALIADGQGKGTIVDDDPPPTVSIDHVTADEGSASGAVFTVSLSAVSGKPITVDYATADGTAMAAADYAAAGGTLTFAPGETEQTVAVPVVGDVLDEFDEDFFVNLSQASNAVIVRARGQGTILDDDLPPAIAIGDVTLDPEGDSGAGDVVFAVTLSAASGKTVTVDYATSDGSAVQGDDYEATAGTLTFLAGETQRTILVSVKGDTLNEPDENFFVDLSNPLNAPLADDRGEGTIVDDDLPSVSIGDVTISPEGNGVWANALFLVTLSSPSNVPVTVDYATTDGTAASGQNSPDYLARSGQVSFQPGGPLQQTIQVLVNGDALDEPDENFFVRLSQPVNTLIGDAEGEGTIVDDDPPPTVSVDDVTVTEGDDGAVDAVFHVSLSAQSGHTVTVDYATADDTALAAEDYTAVSGALTFLPGEVATTVSVPVLGDTWDEFDEIFFLNLSGGLHVTLSGAPGRATIRNDDAPPTISIGDVFVDPEGDDETADAVFVVQLSAASGKVVTVDYVTVNGTAVAGDDYEPVDATLTFEPGQSQQTIAVPVIGDTLEEAREQFVVRLSDPVNAEILDGFGRATIIDDDQPELSIDDVTVDPEGNGSTINAVFTVGLSAAGVNTVIVDFATADGTAVAGDDYLAVAGTLTFPPGVTEQTVSVPVIGDSLLEADETFFVNLFNPVSGVIEDGQGQGTIVDDEPRPTLSIDDVTADPEGNGDALHEVIFTVTLSEAISATVTVGYTTADDTATAGDDYLVTAGMLTFAPGVTEQTVSVNVIGDALNELTENFFVNLAAAVFAEIGDGQGQATIVDDDPAPTLRIADVTFDPEGDQGTVDAVLQVTLSAPSGKTVTVDYTTADGTAIAGDDYQARTGTLTFLPGVTQQTIEVPVIGDVLEEPDEAFFVALSDPDNALIDVGRGRAAIVDDDGSLLSITDVTIDPEGDTATATAIFTVSLLPAAASTVTVDYATADGTATAGDDYRPSSGTLTFETGQTQQTIEVAVIGDLLSEDNETFFVDLSGPANARIADGQGTATIIDDDAIPIPIVYNELIGQDPSSWFALQTTRQGFLTAELTSDGGDLALYADKAASPLVTGRRVDWPAAAEGETYYLKAAGVTDPIDLRLANLVRVSDDGTQVDVYGTDGDDAFEASFAGPPYVVVVKGIRYDATMFPLMTGVHFFGQGGFDTALVTGSDGDEQLTLDPHSGTVTGPDYQLQLSDFSSITVHGEGGHNTVTLSDSAGNDNYVGAPGYAAMYGDGFYNRVYDAAESEAVAGDGVDVAKFYDSPGSDLYTGTPVYNEVSGDGFKNVARYFEGVHVYATAGGFDVAKFFDSPEADNYVATPTYAAMFTEQLTGQPNGSFYNRAKFFEAVHAFATAGGSDLARFYDSPANDDYVATPTYAALFNTEYRQEYTNGFYNRAKYFEGAHAYATAGGSDLARLYDSPQDDVFDADPSQAALYNDTYELEYTHGFYNRAKFFEGVHAYATAGGAGDEARLHGSDGNDSFFADPTQGAMYIAGQYYNRAKFFERVYAEAHQGDGDQARLQDLVEIDPVDDWTRYEDSPQTALFWLRDFEDTTVTAALLSTDGLGKGDGSENSQAVDFLMELEGQNGNL